MKTDVGARLIAFRDALATRPMSAYALARAHNREPRKGSNLARPLLELGIARYAFQAGSGRQVLVLTRAGTDRDGAIAKIRAKFPAPKAPPALEPRRSPFSSFGVRSW